MNIPQYSRHQVKLQKVVNCYGDKVEKISPEVEEWIKDNLVVDHISKTWEVTDEQLELIREQREIEFEKLDPLKGK